KAVHLAPEGVTAYRDIHHLDARPVEVVHLAREQDSSGTGTPHRTPAVAERTERPLEPVAEDEPGDGGALAAGDDQGIEVVQLARPTDLHHFVAHAFEHLAMFAEVALQRED